MLCENCQQRTAQIHVTQTINHQTVEKYLCEQCALETKEQFSPFSFSVHDFLSNFYQDSVTVEADTGHESRKKCSGCGQRYTDYKRTGRFGCPACYRNFRMVILPLVKRIQGSIQHTGKVPVKMERVHRFEKKRQQLQSALKEAVREEAFEKAAELRDQISMLDKKIEQLKEESP